MTEKTAWVIGASSGIGRELAIALVERGYRVAVSARGADKLAALRDAYPGSIVDVVCDVLDPDALEAGITAVADGLTKLDLLIVSAAFWRMGGLAETEPEDFTRTLQTNVVAPFTVIKRAIARGLLNDGASVALLFLLNAP